LSIRLI